MCLNSIKWLLWASSVMPFVVYGGSASVSDTTNLTFTSNTTKVINKKRTTLSYTRNDNTEIVTDHSTNLQWADDVNISTVLKRWLTPVNYGICRGYVGQIQDSSKCADTSGDTATTYCSNLALGGYTNWRLPSIDELMYIADRSKKNSAINKAVFKRQVSNNYLSSTTVISNESLVWGVGFNLGIDDWSHKSNRHLVRCVRDK